MKTLLLFYAMFFILFIVFGIILLHNGKDYSNVVLFIVIALYIDFNSLVKKYLL